MLEGLGRPVSFEKDVQPVLENRCVVCHGHAPCQLLLSSPQGAARGASKAVVYDTTRLLPMAPTRVGIDTQTTAQWRDMGFSPALEEPATAGRGDAAGDATGLANGTLLLRMLALGHANPFPPAQRLPADFGLDINRKLSCAAPGQFDAYAREHPQGGMPYGVA
ncbi:MAG TPA: fatty acid cis/trans isomerase, partial [Myxococcota bacterium]|nr:fatty acid cis/trans isomerase [Myxococcota bacterium]